VRHPASIVSGLALAGLTATAMAGAVALAKEPEAGGKVLFDHKCAMCHGKDGMGTGLLARRMNPAIAELEKRDNLGAAYVTKVARIGIGNMPPITRGDVSDAQMARIAAYLSRGKP
jgi:mono/diheme cytochrome c family protein